MIEVSDLQPPETEFSSELEWVLEAAFAPAPALPSGKLHSARLCAAAKALSLMERIGARQAEGKTEFEPVSVFRKAQVRTAAVALFYESIARDVAEAAAGLEIPVVFLKGMALVLSQATPAGARSLGDLDILVPKERAEELFRELLSREFTSSPAESTEQHLPQLRPPQGGSLEVHFALRGLQIIDGQPARFETLEESESLSRLESFPGSSYLPTTPLMAAHALVHGFQQHLLRPRSYPMFRMIADLIDIQFADAEWIHPTNPWLAAIAHAVSDRSVEATRVLCESLRIGRRPDRSTHPDAARLLRHLLAGCLDPDYAESLRGPYLRNRLGEAYRRGDLGRYIMRKLRPLLGGRRPTLPD